MALSYGTVTYSEGAVPTSHTLPLALRGSRALPLLEDKWAALAGSDACLLHALQGKADSNHEPKTKPPLSLSLRLSLSLSLLQGR